MTEETDWAALAEAMRARALGDGRQEFGAFFLARLLGFETSFEDERCIVSFDVTPGLFNPQGTLHGGMFATAMDISMGHLINRLDGAATTLEMKVQFMAPARAGRVRCEGSFLRRGRGISFLQSHAYDAERRLLAHATATWKRLKPAAG